MIREFTADDRWLFNNGEHERLYLYLGAHVDTDRTQFRVWAPNAERVSVVGDWNAWDPAGDPMLASESGVWEVEVMGAHAGARYKYFIVPRNGGRPLEKADPFAFHAETRPDTASIVWDLDHLWHDDDWMATRAARNALDAPMSIYECHLGSWSRQGPLEYVALAKGLADHLESTGFTHVELMPVMEHPFDGSWGYQSTGYFAPTSRFGTPQGLMEFVDIMHRRGIGVILDWVPSHFAVDAHGLARFDGTHLYEHSDPRQGFHPDWGSFIFNYGRSEVRAFLLSSAHYWMELYHADGLRVDGVASMLYLDYSRKDGEWIPNIHGGRENLEAVSFITKLNASLYGRFPGIQTIAEESTAWPLVTRPTDTGGLGFGYKWDMGWMNDTLRYFGMDPIFRGYEDNHRLLTFRGLYAFTENYVLAISHDEVVHGKRSLLDKQPGDEWRRFAGLRALLGYQWALPGKKLLFMGSEIASPYEWNHEGEIPFYLLDYQVHAGVLAFMAALNRMYRSTPALHLRDLHEDGFAWVEADDSARSTIVFLRCAEGHPPVLVVCNFTPEVWEDHQVGVPDAGTWTTLLSSDAEEFGGTGLVPGVVTAGTDGAHGHAHSVRFDVPPLSVTFFAPRA
ncbi:MAG TPA: 1,4-alpha-glucan branching protein GlgB [Acidimicrobiia bacterium]|nr:1,4-alpha-glucan branching protein GlgB [Acidimicrobiia bacterium]